MILVLFSASILLSCLPFHLSATDHSTSMSICPDSFCCPNMASFNYPFYNATDTDTQCGLIQVRCNSNGGEIQLEGESYEIVSKHMSAPSLEIHNRTFEKLINHTSCEALMYSFTSPSPLLYSISIGSNLTLYKCAKSPAKIDTYFNQSHYNKYNRCKDHDLYFSYSEPVLIDVPPRCEAIVLPKISASSEEGERNLDDYTDLFSLLNPVYSISFNLSLSCDRCHKEERHCHSLDGQFQCLDVQQVAAETEKSHRNLKEIVVTHFSSSAQVYRTQRDMTNHK